ncbi:MULTISPECIES: hypothetical protein [Cyanophyceae]|uniref:DUF7734 family protein n=1 Tax=Cyanophyceae TaxID=3028117 RepID=UPI00016DCD9A|nr:MULTISPECIES: hypothetical protein [Cyanophyceae]ACB00512.1 conserved hypothetical protein [Picosynechococcus sp. PCC 7002]AMA10096.1 hypothetical protein AWQ23_12650 [Picosynechococcus sp. PCC 73109]ANV88261.1 hypothetical protein AWQ22_12770 [Picosynechococcus sp. PCC 7117]QCS48361.1 hypothetical protein FEK30_02310 [Picosynechococcus sp. PCC 11901]SMH50007.1 hypothetical protein SAMN06272755_2157 [Picosynechococcus sp. OG1]
MTHQSTDFSRLAKHLEAYTRKYAHEVLLLHLGHGEIEDQIIIFKGFSSSLMQPTDYNPDNPVLAEMPILRIDRLQSPYNPNQPIFLEQNLSLEQMQQYLSDADIC